MYSAIGSVPYCFFLQNISSVPVVDDDGRILGVISASDIKVAKIWGG